MRSRYGFTLHGHFLSEPDVGNEFGRAHGGGRTRTRGRTMTGRAARETRSCGTAWPGQRGPAGRRAARRTAVRGARGRLAGGRGGLGGARRVLGDRPGSIKHAETVSCDGIQAAWDGSGGGRLTRDNWCYRPSNGRIHVLRRPPDIRTAAPRGMPEKCRNAAQPLVSWTVSRAREGDIGRRHAPRPGAGPAQAPPIGAR